MGTTARLLREAAWTADACDSTDGGKRKAERTSDARAARRRSRRARGASLPPPGAPAPRAPALHRPPASAASAPRERTIPMLRRAAFAALTLALAATAGSAEAQRTAWQIDDGTAVRFVCQGPQVESAAEGRFSSVNARLEMDPTELQTARGAVQVLLASITTDLGGWDAMFRAAPFLALDEHPRATFELLAVEGAERLRPGRWTRLRLRGRMTVKGTMREVEVPARARWTAAEGDEPERVELRARFRIDWDDYDIAVPDGWTRNFAGDRARVDVVLKLRRAAPAAE
ncbi:MAG: hypothetical protein CMN29_23545 [Sandaracinus sp.]|nr:hypothetical protein [Myxococcales bacterium]MAT27895.1 hypothetical protein [Sandaracinus sp.]